MDNASLKRWGMVAAAAALIAVLYFVAIPDTPQPLRSAEPVALLDTLVIEAKDGNGTHRDFIIPARAPADRVRARLVAFYEELQPAYTWAQVDLYTSFEAWDEHRNGFDGFRPVVAAMDTGYVAQITFSPQQGSAQIQWFAGYGAMPPEQF